MKKIEEAKMELAKMMEEAKMEKVNEILQLCFEISSLKRRQKELTGNKPTIFFRFYGHITELEIDIYETGWDEDEDEYKSFSLYLDYPFEEIEPDMENCIQYLKSLKERSCQELQTAV